MNLIATSIVGCTDSIQQQLNVLTKYIDENLLKVLLTKNTPGDIQVSTQINNSGYNTIDEITLVVDLNNEFKFRETFKRKIYSGRNDGFTFGSTFIPDAGKKIDFFFQILSGNGEIDSILTNNELCELGFNNEFILKLYRNPVRVDLHLQYTLLDYGMVKLSILDVLGREIGLLIDEFQQEGYCNSVIDLSSFESGLYL